MTNQIKDGTGKGYLAAVSKTNKLLTESTVLSHIHSISNDTGQAYVVTTNFVSISDTTIFHGVLYIQNNSPTHLHLELILSGQTSITQWKFLRNPITGTIVTTENPANETNLNFISNNVANLTAYEGFEGATIAGLSAANWITPGGGFPINLGGAILLGPNDSVGFSAKPSVAGTLSMSIMLYFE